MKKRPRARHLFRRHRMLGGMALLALASAVALKAQSIVFSNFSSTSGLVLTSVHSTPTTSDGTVVRLVASGESSAVGGMFSSSQLNVTTFSTAFQFRLTSPAGIDDGTAIGADGFTFTVRRGANNTLGSSGSGLGYSGIGQSVAVEFDTFNNGSGDNNSTNHVTIDKLGSLTALITPVTVSPVFDDGNLWTAWIDYDGTNLEVRVNETGIRPGSPLLSLSLALTGTIGGSTAYVGFTAATGAASENDDIIKWTFSDSYISGGVTAGSPIPEPSTYGLFAGVFALTITALVRRRLGRNQAD